MIEQFYRVSRRLKRLWLKTAIPPQPTTSMDLPAFLERIGYLDAAVGNKPLCLDLGDRALIIYPENLRQYVYEDGYLIELYMNSIRSNHCVLDLGAHNGYYALTAARRVGNDGRVYAFEPEPENFKALQMNIALNEYTNIIRPYQICAGDKREQVTLVAVDECSRSSSLYLHPMLHRRNEFSVESAALDELLDNLIVDVIKMDIEGSEPYALRGMTKLISRSPSLTLFAELHPTMLAGRGVKWEDYLEQLRRLGFRVQIVDEESRSLLPVSPDFIRARAEDIWWHTNLYAVKAPGTLSV